ncbi:hypothetical protein ZWY2020_016035 [Hordeum vulgare]|nr:hypothetical protein ZWY2020_016035 [Hordeum vulgare]
MSSKASPLHGVVDARRWKAERILGRLVIVVHAAFLDAGFIVPRRDRQIGSAAKLSTEVGATARRHPLSTPRNAARARHERRGRGCVHRRARHLLLQVCSPDQDASGVHRRASIAPLCRAI